MTNKIALRTVEEFMAGYTPIYRPIYPLFLTKEATWPMEAAVRNFRRVEAVGDLRGKHITPKDTEIQQIQVQEGKKPFKCYAIANQFILSVFQDTQGVDDVTAQVLDEHQRHQDELFLLGEGTSSSNMLNNGLYYSNDTNYTLNGSAEVQHDADDSYLADLHGKVATSAILANQVAGRKVIIFYGELLLPVVNSIFPSGFRSFKALLAETLGPNYSIVELPTDVTPADSNGYIIANLDQLKTHRTALPQLQGRGFNEEKLYIWSNFVQGSMMLEVLAKNAIIRQPTTLEAIS